jgi:hypothetical protein
MSASANGFRVENGDVEAGRRGDHPIEHRTNGDDNGDHAAAPSDHREAVRIQIDRCLVHLLGESDVHAAVTGRGRTQYRLDFIGVPGNVDLPAGKCAQESHISGRLMRPPPGCPVVGGPDGYQDGTEIVGVSLDEIGRSLAGLPAARNPTRKDWERLSGSWREQLDDRIDELISFRDELSGCIGCGCLSLDRCALFNADDRAAARGPGARYLLGDTPTP